MGRGRAVIAALLTALTLASGCVKSNPAPSGFVRTADETLKSPNGAWISVEITGIEQPVQGELLAVGGTSLYILELGEVAEVNLKTIKSASLSAYEAAAGGVVTLTLLGGASTISHGFFLIFSFPIWLAVGIATSRHQSGMGYAAYDSDNSLKKLQGFGKWARFPQGMPEDFGKKTPAPPVVIQGSAGNACYPNGTCNQGLVCSSEQRCVAEPAPGAAGGRCFSTGACDPGLVCTQARCAAPVAPRPEGPNGPSATPPVVPSPEASPR